MKKILPDVKLIVILRNPVDRAYSHYHHMLRKSMEIRSFEEAIELEEKRHTEMEEQTIDDSNSVPSHYGDRSYLARSVYVDQLETWFRYYDREQFLILTTDTFREDPQQILDQVFKFLGVFPFQAKDFRDLNVGDYMEMKEGTRKFLIEYFKPHNKRLSKLLQRRFDWDK